MFVTAGFVLTWALGKPAWPLWVCRFLDSAAAGRVSARRARLPWLQQGGWVSSAFLWMPVPSSDLLALHHFGFAGGTSRTLPVGSDLHLCLACFLRWWSPSWRASSMGRFGGDATSLPVSSPLLTPSPLLPQPESAEPCWAVLQTSGSANPTDGRSLLCLPYLPALGPLAPVNHGLLTPSALSWTDSLALALLLLPSLFLHVCPPCLSSALWAQACSRKAVSCSLFSVCFPLSFQLHCGSFYPPSSEYLFISFGFFFPPK